MHVFGHNHERPRGRGLQEQQPQHLERAGLDRLGARNVGSGRLIDEADQAAQPHTGDGGKSVGPHRLIDGVPHRVRGVCLRDVTVGAQQITQRQIRNKAAVRHTTSLENRDRLRAGGHRACGLVDQPRLSHAGLADHADGVTFTGTHLCEQTVEQRHLTVAPDECAEHATLQQGMCLRPEAGDPERGRAADLPNGLALHVLGDRALGRVADQNGARLGKLLQEVGGAERIADSHVLDVLLIGHAIDHERPRGDAGLHRDAFFIRRVRRRETSDTAVDAECRQNRAARIVFVNFSRAENRDESIRVPLRDDTVVPGDFLLRDHQHLFH